MTTPSKKIPSLLLLCPGHQAQGEGTDPYGELEGVSYMVVDNSNLVKGLVLRV